MITCPNCGRENADNFNFCLDCGTELGAAATPPPAAPPPAAPPPAASKAPVAPAASPSPTASRPAPAPVPPSAPTGPMVPAAAAPSKPAVAAPPGPTAAGATGQMGAAAGASPCPKCSTPNAAGMKFCGNCGHRLDGSAPTGTTEAAGGGKTMFMHAADMSALSQPKARLITIDQHGKEGMTFNLSAKETVCGRTNGTILFFDDPYVSPTHCVFIFEKGRLAVVDKSSLNGVYMRVRADWPLADGDMVRVGRQLFKLETELVGGEKLLVANPDDDAKVWGSPDPGSWSRLVQVLDNGQAGEVHLLRGEECRIGREVGDIILHGDGFVSASHCALTAQGARVVLRDLGSSNGTYVRLREARELTNDDFVLIGNQMLRVELR
ncbi:MAG: FHA domain-containing protein [Pseudomonadota bacterium]